MADVEIVVPHFDLPFRLAPSHGRLAPATVEQDTLDEIGNCVEMAVRYRQGQRLMVPSFGITDPVFEVQPLDTEGMRAQIYKHEPRANMLVTQEPDYLDKLIDKVRIRVSSGRG